MTSNEVGDFVAFNKDIIDEFRANKGIVGGVFEGLPLALITTKGAKSGEDRVSPLSYFQDENRIAIAATFAGSERNPAWFHNLIAHPEAVVEVGSDRYEATAVRVKGKEADRLFEGLADGNPRVATYKILTNREIPVFVLERKAS